MIDKFRTSILDWDSNFFNLKIARISVTEFNNDIQNELQVFYRQNCDLVYIEIPCNPEKQDSDKFLGKLVDIKCTYIIDTVDFRGAELDENIKECKIADKDLYSLALQSGHESRYRVDPNFAPGEFERLYKTWIDNSISKQIANHVFGYYEDNKLQGFITLLLKQDCGEIGLFAVNAGQRGKGIGRKLMSAAYYATAREGKSILRVTTQSGNRRACAFYEHYGFRLETSVCIYHKWFKKK